jgi:PAS domain S-box-containing protein
LRKEIKKTVTGNFSANGKVFDSLYHQMIDDVEDYAILMIDKSGIIQNWNKGAEKIKGYASEEVIGKNFRIFYSKEDQENKLPELLLKEAKKNGNAAHEGWRIIKGGDRFWGSVVISVLHNEHKKVIGFTKITRNLTERKLALENRFKAIIDSQEKERKQISTELHDNLGQVLASCKLLLNALPEELKDNPLIKKCSENISNTIQEIRNISHRIGQDILVRTGLAHAIKSLADDINQTGFLKVKTTFFIKNEKIMAQDLQLSVFRIVQEQLHNILKHSGAKNASISMSIRHRKLHVSVTDDGKGFQVSKVKKGLGLQNIYDRTELFRGKANITSSKSKGTSLIVEIPLPNKKLS